MSGPEDQDPIEEAEREIRRMVRDYESRLLAIGEHHARAGVHADDPVDGARRLADIAIAVQRYVVHDRDCPAIPRPDNLGEVGCTCGLSASLGDSDDDYVKIEEEG